MAEQQEKKDNFWIYVGVVILVVVVGVFIAKGRSTKAIPSSAVQEIQQEQPKRVMGE